MMDMPIDIQSEVAGNIDLGSISQNIANYTPTINVVREIWDTQTLEQLIDGKVNITDDVINQSLAAGIEDNPKIKSITVKSVGNGKLQLAIDAKKIGRVNLLCRIDQFEHNADVSQLKFKVLEKELLDNGTLSWIFSRVSLSFAEKFVGKVDLGDNVKTKIRGNTVTVDFHDAVKATDFGKTEILGYSLCDAVLVKQAVPQDGYIEFQTDLNVPASVKGMLSNILK